MAEKFKIELVTPRGIVLGKMVEEVIAPGVMGEFGVLIGHTPMLTFIKPGVFSYLESDRFVKYVVGPGFCEVLKDSVMVLVEEAHAVESIDKAQATEELAVLERQLLEIDAVENAAEYERVLNRVKVARTKISLVGGN
ncbi:MAG: ATP synthase F1 subunit epsilon [Deltaproteobacteria bacterium]|nr:ATP synthase F1 subunit epsilon [Deltaproteobacteria bacterium]